jgi:hypothetical protein
MDAKEIILILAAMALILGFAGMARADIVELSLSCEGQYDSGQSWAAEFDLGVTFTEISNVYIDWSGKITAELVGADPSFPIDAQFVAKLYESDPYDYLGNAYVRAGVVMYPDPEPFDLRSAFTNEGWSMLLDGKGSIKIWFGGIIRPEYLGTVKPPSGLLESVTLVFDGVPIPEPVTILSLGSGFLILRRKK